MNQIKSNGAVIWQGPSAHDGAPIVVIVTGLQRASRNRKTGAMLQTWILRADVDPLTALATGQDSSICGTCPLRGLLADGRRTGRACYVTVHRAPLNVWRAFDRGAYPVVDPADVAALAGDYAIRLGSYGDPAMVPLDVWRALTANARTTTGYTHQWKSKPEFAGLLMASADSLADRRDARLAGWRSFVIVPKGSAIPSGAMECAATRGRNPLTCSDCGACAGTRNGSSVNAVDVAIVAHGPGARYVNA